MSRLFNKLNLRDQKEILVLHAPESFKPELAELYGVHIKRDLSQAESVDFLLAFVQSSEEIENLTESFTGKAPGDPVIWFAYPKKSSKKYDLEINRDQGWEPLDQAGFQPVRQVAIDQDWSALRFRRKEQVGS